MSHLKKMPTAPKGQLTSKCLFVVFNFFQNSNENKSTWGIIVVKSNSFVRFLEETSAWKNHFEFVWPLVSTLISSRRVCIKFYCAVVKSRSFKNGFSINIFRLLEVLYSWEQKHVLLFRKSEILKYKVPVTNQGVLLLATIWYLKVFCVNLAKHRHSPKILL